MHRCPLTALTVLPAHAYHHHTFLNQCIWPCPSSACSLILETVPNHYQFSKTSRGARYDALYKVDEGAYSHAMMVGWPQGHFVLP